MRKLPVGLHGEEHEAGRPRHRPGKLIPTNPANRIPLLTAGKVDVVFASFTTTNERAKVVDFTTPYFLVGQQFLAKAIRRDPKAVCRRVSHGQYWFGLQLKAAITTRFSA